VQADFTFKIDTSMMNREMIKMVERQPYKFSLNILGLRDLKSSGLCAVQRAFVKINISSLFENRFRRSNEDILTQPRIKGANPNLNYSIDFLLDLPKKI